MQLEYIGWFDTLQKIRLHYKIFDWFLSVGKVAGSRLLDVTFQWKKWEQVI